MDFEVVFWIGLLVGAVAGGLWLLNEMNKQSYVSHGTIARIENGGRHL
mgnify:CR=1 FL=1